jgi:hypothetical protein
MWRKPHAEAAPLCLNFGGEFGNVGTHFIHPGVPTMKMFASILLFISTQALASQPEVFVHSAVMTANAETLIVRVSYCGDEANFQFDLKQCAPTVMDDVKALRCYEVVPKARYVEACRRVVTRTETFDFKCLGENPPPAESVVQLRGDRESLVEVRTPKNPASN